MKEVVEKEAMELTYLRNEKCERLMRTIKLCPLTRKCEIKKVEKTGMKTEIPKTLPLAA